MTGSDKTRTSQTLARGLLLLNCLAQAQTQAQAQELGNRELVERLDLPPTVVSRLATTLVAHGYLYQNRSTRKYRLGLSAYLLGVAADPQVELRHAARPAMERLASETKESVSLTVIDPASGEGLCIDSLDSPNPIKLTTVVGSLRPLHRGATRKVLLAHLPMAVQRDYTAKLELTPDEQAALLDDLATITHQGYAYS